MLDFAEIVVPHLAPQTQGEHITTKNYTSALRAALDRYEDTVISRSRPAVLASRQACMDAHEWGRINEKSPLLTRRVMKLEFDGTAG